MENVSKVRVNGMVGYCVDAETKADAIKMLELYQENDRLKEIIANLEKECEGLEDELDELKDYICDFWC